jgi:hypothetical protein
VNILSIFIVLALAVVLFYACKEKTTEPSGQGPISFSYHVSTCLGEVAKRSNFDSMIINPDSTFTYTFTNSLITDFSVTANCYLDSNRFVVSHNISNDTIVIAVTDTAGNYAECACVYMIYTKFDNLPNDHYVVRCKITYSHSNGFIIDPLYLVDVYRKK